MLDAARKIRMVDTWYGMVPYRHTNERNAKNGASNLLLLAAALHPRRLRVVTRSREKR